MLDAWLCSPIPDNCFSSFDDGSESFSSLRSNVHALHIATCINNTAEQVM